MARTNFERLRVYRLAEELSDEVWRIAKNWTSLARDTLARQLIRAADSIGANIAEGCGRRSFQDHRRFVCIARGSLNETKHWLRRAYTRSLLSENEIGRLKAIIDNLAPQLNSYLKSIGREKKHDGQVLTTDYGPETTD